MKTSTNTSITKLSEPLKIEDIDFRIQSINNGKYATILAYKDARVDIQRLNSVCGILGWKRAHTRDNKNCIVSVWCDDKREWVSKEDTGTESNMEEEKGLASDSFKRACFNLGIGIELYDYPTIQIRLNDDEVEETGKTKPKFKASYKLNLKKWRWNIQLDESKKITFLGAKDESNKLRFSYGEFNK